MARESITVRCREHRSTRRRLTPVVSALALISALDLPAARAAEPSPAYRASLQRTLELRKQRRRTSAPSPVGVIVPYPLPPVLVIRQTPEVHEDIGGLLDLLRRSR